MSPFTGNVQNRYICKGRCVVGVGVNGEIRWVGVCQCYFGDEEKVLKLITVMDAQL